MANVRAVYVELGHAVTEGQRLIVLDARDFEARRNQAEAAAREAATAAAEADSAVAAARANLELAETTYGRMQTLFERKSISNQEFDEASARLRSAKANLEMAAARRKLVDAKIEQAFEEAAAARIQSGHTVLTAPFAGVVAAKNIEPGGLAVPGAPLLTIERRDGFRFHAQAAEGLAANVRRGAAIPVTIDSLGRSMTGKVAEISPAVDAAGHSFLVKIDLPPAEGLRSGLFGRASFRSGTRRAVVVPENAIVERGQMRWVFVAENGEARGRIVTTGSAREGMVEALSGVSAGERVVSPAPRDLADGTPIEVAP
jgi:RND family efflux transporter MFP subunit